MTSVLSGLAVGAGLWIFLLSVEEDDEIEAQERRLDALTQVDHGDDKDAR